MCLKKGVKGLMALMACLIVFIGMSLTVKAANYYIGDNSGYNLPIGSGVSQGDYVMVEYGCIKLFYNGVEAQGTREYSNAINPNDKYYSSYTISGDSWKVSNITDGIGHVVLPSGDYTYLLKKVYLTNNTESSPAVQEAAAVSTSNTATSSHVHNYEWVTVREATATEDGEMDYMCSCGDVKERQIIPKYVGATKEVNDALDAAKSGQTITLDTGDNCSFNRDTMDKIANDTQNNIKVVIKYIYKGVHYIMTIPAGSNPAAIRGCVDGNGYAGFRQIDKVFPGTVVK